MNSIVAKQHLKLLKKANKQNHRLFVFIFRQMLKNFVYSFLIDYFRFLFYNRFITYLSTYFTISLSTSFCSLAPLHSF